MFALPAFGLLERDSALAFGSGSNIQTGKRGPAPKKSP